MSGIAGDGTLSPGTVAPGRVAITVAPSSERTCTNVPGGANRIPPPRAGAAQGMGRLVERAVGAVEQERAQRRVRRDVGDEEPDSRERDDRQQEPRTQRQALAHGYDASSM